MADTNDEGMRSWRSKNGRAIFVDKGDGERVIVRDLDGDGHADHVYETGRRDDDTADDGE